MIRINSGLLAVSLFATLTSTILQAQDSCNPKGMDVCKMARQIADETAANLPVRLNKNLSVQTVFAERNAVTMIAKFEYNKVLLDKTLATAGVTNDQMLKVMHEHSRSSMCNTNSPTKQFIDSGGVIRYVYKFNDGSMYTSVDVTSCA